MELENLLSITLQQTPTVAYEFGDLLLRETSSDRLQIHENNNIIYGTKGVGTLLDTHNDTYDIKPSSSSIGCYFFVSSFPISCQE